MNKVPDISLNICLRQAGYLDLNFSDSIQYHFVPPDILALGVVRVVRLMPTKPQRGAQDTRKRNERTAT